MLRGADVGCGSAVGDDERDDSAEDFAFDGLIGDGVDVLSFSWLLLFDLAVWRGCIS